MNAPSLRGRELIVAAGGGIATFKTAALVSQLVQREASVSVVLTRNACRFVAEPTFAALIGKPVAKEVFDMAHPLGTHITLAQNAQLLCVAPATANVIGKLANGIADDLLSTLYLAFSGAVMIAPAMNAQMWDHPAVQRNVNQLREDGVKIIDPEEGWLSCRVKGIGRMADPDRILDLIQQQLGS